MIVAGVVVSIRAKEFQHAVGKKLEKRFVCYRMLICEKEKLYKRLQH